MRFLTPDCPYYSPLTTGTIESLFNEIFLPFSRGMSTTVSLRKGFGGGKALVRFMIDNVDQLCAKTRIPVTMKTHVYLFLDPDTADTSSEDGIWRDVGMQLTEATGIRLRAYSSEGLAAAIGECILKKELVIVFRGLNYLAVPGGELLPRLQSFWVHSQRVHYLFILYGGAPDACMHRSVSRIRDLLFQNVVKIEPLTNVDVEYSIDRWGYVLEHDFTLGERALISRVGKGYPSIVKACCFAIAGGNAPTLGKGWTESELRKTASVRSLLERAYSSEHIFGENQWTIFSIKEARVFQVLWDNRGFIVSKDAIADALWGNSATERYSEAAIVQIVRRVRTKIKMHGKGKLVLRVVYGRGYSLENCAEGSGIHSMVRSTEKPVLKLT